LSEHNVDAEQINISELFPQQ